MNPSPRALAEGSRGSSVADMPSVLQPNFETGSAKAGQYLTPRDGAAHDFVLE